MSSPTVSEVDVRQRRRCNDDRLTFPEYLSQGMSDIGRFLVSVCVGEDTVDGTCVHGEQSVVLCVGMLKSTNRFTGCDWKDRNKHERDP
jgi:hypothetical protein